MLKTIHDRENQQAARQKAAEVVRKFREMRLLKAAGIVESGGEETLPYYDFPSTLGGLSERTTPLNGSTKKSGAEPEWLKTFRTACGYDAGGGRAPAHGGQKRGLTRSINMAQEIIH